MTKKLTIELNNEMKRALFKAKKSYYDVLNGRYRSKPPVHWSKFCNEGIIYESLIYLNMNVEFDFWHKNFNKKNNLFIK